MAQEVKRKKKEKKEKKKKKKEVKRNLLENWHLCQVLRYQETLRCSLTFMPVFTCIYCPHGLKRKTSRRIIPGPQYRKFGYHCPFNTIY